MNNITISIKIVIFGIDNNKLIVLLKNDQLIKAGVTEDDDLDEIAKTIFTTITSIPLKDNYIEQLYTVRGNKKEVSIVYYVLLSEKTKTLPQQFRWVDTHTIKKTLDDFSIIAYAIQRLRWKIEYTNVIYSLLPKTFTLTQLQKAYETILGKSLDKRNFRKKILSLNFCEATGQKHTETRPAQMYRFKKRKLVLVKVFS